MQINCVPLMPKTCARLEFAEDRKCLNIDPKWLLAPCDDGNQNREKEKGGTKMLPYYKWNLGICLLVWR